jgi:hypothetical protein
MPSEKFLDSTIADEIVKIYDLIGILENSEQVWETMSHISKLCFML